MASIQKKGDAWYCQFVHRGKRLTFALGKVSEAEANSVAEKVGYTLMRVKQQLLHVPPGMDILTFLRHDGRPPAAAVPDRKEIAFEDFQGSYLKAMSQGAVEENTLVTIKIHLKHLSTTLGSRFPIQELGFGDLQKHVDRRLKTVASVTIKKELASLRSGWNWAVRMELVEGTFPGGKLVYPKTEEKPPFMTWKEIQRRIKSGASTKQLWECLFLTTEEMAELLVHVKQAKGPDWLYPMLCLACHTGARRSELIRAKAEDVDLVGSVITFREKKRTRGLRTTRRVPLSAFLEGVLKEWLAGREDMAFLLGQGLKMLAQQTTQEMLRGALKDSKWSVVHGFHTLRHSFISACASQGIDQRFIDEWVGHQTEEQRRRYRHLLPSSQKLAISSVFGGAR